MTLSRIGVRSVAQWAFIVGALCVSCAAQGLPPPPPVVVRIDGEATFRKPGKEWQKVTKTSFLDVDAEIRTSVESELDLEFLDGSLLTIRAESDLQLTMGFRSPEFLLSAGLRLGRGEVSAQATRNIIFMFLTPVASTSIRDGNMTVRFQEQSEPLMYSIVESGTAEVIHSSLPRVMLSANQFARSGKSVHIAERLPVLAAGWSNQFLNLSWYAGSLRAELEVSLSGQVGGPWVSADVPVVNESGLWTAIQTSEGLARFYRLRYVFDD